MEGYESLDRTELQSVICFEHCSERLGSVKFCCSSQSLCVSVFSYMYQLQTKYQHEIFYESHLMAKKICMWFAQHTADDDAASGLETVVTKGGTAAALVELFTRKQV
jgi:hypothetical protein